MVKFELKKFEYGFKITKKSLVAILVLFALLVGSIALSLSLETEAEQILIEASPLPEVSDVSEYTKLIISEVVANNGGIYADESNDCCDYVELYNGSSRTINLEGYGLSDRSDKVKWLFPSAEIKPGEYLVVNLTGEKEDGLNANFKLSSKGEERLILLNKSGRVIDGVDMPALSKNQSLVRDGASWIISDYATPGFENSQTGLTEYRESLIDTADSSIVINELLVRNKGNYISSDGRYDGCIELKNVSTETICLADYCLSNDEYIPFKFTLPNVTLAPGEIYCMYTGDSSSSLNHTGFNFDSKYGEALLSCKGKIVQTLKYENLTNGCAYIRDDNGTYYISADLSLGFENNPEGTEQFEKANMAIPEGLIISEVMSNNTKYLAQNGGAYYDWIELKNNTDYEISLSDYFISESDDNLMLQQLPDVTLSAGEYYVIMCSGDNSLSNDSYFHANFKIGESTSVYLSNGNKITDSVFVYSIPKDYSLSRGDEYGWLYTDTPTPKKTNRGGYYTVSPAPVILTQSGLYDDVPYLDVEISGQGTIYYTVDGSLPTKKSSVYTEPIRISKTTSLRVSACIDGGIMSEDVCSSFILNDTHDLPVVCITMNPDDYAVFYSDQKWYDNQFRASFELFEDDGYCQSFCGVSLMGHSSRIFEKKTLALRFDTEWGESDLNYKVFGDIDCSRYDALVLRGGSNSEESLPWKDEFATELAEDYLEVRTYKTCVVYINGVYKGLYNLREKINAEMIADHYNVDKERVSIQRWSGTTLASTGDLEHGTTVWSDIVKWGISHDLSIDENYEYFCKKVDVQGLCDLWIYQAFMNNPDIYNIRVFSHPDIDDGQCKFIFFDLDMGWWGKYTNYFTDVVFNSSGLATNQVGHTYSVEINNCLLKNENFRKLFMERLEYHLSNHLSPEYALQVYDSFAELYAPEVERTMNANGYTVDRYNYNLKVFRSTVSRRAAVLRNQIKAVIN